MRFTSTFARSGSVGGLAVGLRLLVAASGSCTANQVAASNAMQCLGEDIAIAVGFCVILFVGSVVLLAGDGFPRAVVGALVAVAVSLGALNAAPFGNLSVIAQAITLGVLVAAAVVGSSLLLHGCREASRKK